MAWGLLLNARGAFDGISYSFFAETVAAMAALATAVIAFQASKTWRSQLRGEHDLDLGRRIALQIARCEEVALQLYGGAQLSIVNAEAANDSELWHMVSDYLQQNVNESKETVSQLVALTVEYRAWWGEPPADVFNPIFNFLDWAAGCCTNFHQEHWNPASPSAWTTIPVETRLASRLSQAEKLGIEWDIQATPSRERISKFFKPAKDHISQKMKL
tara:strand:- start:1163 stop:1810 length:648 start_codon:yes stop_codon:yes gene_type:complete